MKLIRRHPPRASTALAFVVGIALAAALLPAGVVAAPSAKDVFAFITDPDDNSRKAKVDESGALKVASSGTATVNGSVHVANTPLPVSGTVSVGNLPGTQQVSGSVKVESLPPIQPFQAGTGVSLSSIEDGETALVEGFRVPSGKRLVIQHVSGLVSLAGAGQQLSHVHMVTIVGGSVQRYWFRPVQLPAGSWQFGEELTLYADPSTTVGIAVNRSGGVSGTGGVQWAVSGYLTDA